MSSTTFAVRVEPAVKRGLERLARSTGRSRSFLAAEALTEYLDVNEWQVERIKQAMEALDRGGGMAHDEVKRLVRAWRAKETPRLPRRPRS